MKKFLYAALALPLLFSCSSDDLMEKKVISNNQFDNIEKVDATFSMTDGSITRMANDWALEEGDLYGFAWMGGGEATALTIDGNAWQNHPLTQKDGIFTPATSIYVGNYYIYRPYDETTVNIGAINFKSLEEQTLQDGQGGSNWSALAKNAIIIGDKWTNVTAAGYTKSGSSLTWGKPGIGQHYEIYAAFFSNQTGLDLTYKKNNPTFSAAKRVQGATDIDYTYAAGTSVGAADIYEATVDLDGAAKSFTYAPTAQPTATHSGTYWADKKNLGTAEGFTFTDDVITLKAADATNGISTGDNGSKAWFWFNSLPVTAGNATLTTNVQTVLTTSYGVVTVTKTLDDCAYVYDQYAGTGSNEWIKLSNVDNATTTPKKWNLAGTHNTFVNQYGNHHGKYAFDVDFSTGVMNNMHIKSDAHLQKLLKYYIASGKTENVVLNLDQAGTGANNVFKISKLSIALLQTINASSNKVLVQACGTHGTPKVIVTQEGQADLGLADKKEVPALNKVFNTPTAVYLSKDCEWTWMERTGSNQLTIDANVTSITNEGTLTVNATNLKLSVAASTLVNAAGATMNITKVTTVKNALTNLGTINVGDASNTAAELRAYGVEIKNDATGLTDGKYGIIKNYGVVGVTAGTTGEFNNYGYIKMMNNDAITLLTSNEKGGNFAAAFAAGSNMMGIVELPEGNATALVSVSNATNQGFIKYNWTAKTYATPAGNVKYNTIIVSDDITFTTAESEIQYIEFDGNRTQVINSTASNLPNLKGIYVHDGKSIIIEKTNIVSCSDGAYLGPRATVYKGGIFNYVSTTNYFGNWLLDQIVEY